MEDRESEEGNKFHGLLIERRFVRMQVIATLKAIKDSWRRTPFAENALDTIVKISQRFTQKNKAQIGTIF